MVMNTPIYVTINYILSWLCIINVCFMIIITFKIIIAIDTISIAIAAIS